MASGKNAEAPGKRGGERSGVAVVVPTTAGAIQVLGLRWSQRIPSSRVVLGNETSDQCERWTKDYNSLLRPGDPMRTLLGLPDGGGCRLVVSAEIDHGRSWMVPIAAAHFADARAQAVHADTGRARLLIWGTGALDFSQPETADQATIVENDYHLTSKIDLSRAHFASAAHDGTPVLCLLPAGGDAERAATILRKVLGQQPHHVEIVASLADVIRPITAYLNKGDFNAPPDMKYAPVPYTPPPEVESEEPVVAAATTSASPSRPAAEPTPTAPLGAPPVFGTTSPEVTQPKAPPAKGGGGGLSMGVLGGIAAVLVAVIGAGAVMLRSGTPTAPASPPVVGQTPAVPPVAPQAPTTVVVTAPTVVPPGVQAPVVTAPVVTAPVVTAPVVTQPAMVQPPVISAPAGPPTTAPPAPLPPALALPSPPVVPAPPVTATPSAPAPATPAATLPAAALPAPGTAGPPAVALGRLTLLTAPPGSSCQAQVLEMNPRFMEFGVELNGAQPVLEIESPALCGLAIAGSGSVQARFAPGTVAGTVASLSSAGRIIFNPSANASRLPDIAITGGGIEKIELRRK